MTVPAVLASAVGDRSSCRTGRPAAPLAEGHEERVALWQLFPLLVHAVLFGGGYGASVARIARRYVS